MFKMPTNVQVLWAIRGHRDRFLKMQSYLKAVHEHRLDALNQKIGKAVKAAYQLNNIADRENNPSCTLIQSHQKFK